MTKSLFGWLRGRKNKPPAARTDVRTVPLSDQFLEEVVVKSPRVEPQQLVYGCAQSVGKQREHNEDCIFAMSFTFGGEVSSLPLGLFIIADGMGGHSYGEIASAVAVHTMSGYLLKRFHPYLVNPSESIDESLQDLMRAAINEAQRAVMQTAPGSGTTLTAALVLGQQMIVAHVGDSRAYIIRPHGDGEVLTRDHSLVKRLEELGQISSEEAAAHPQRNVLYRAVGQSDTLEADVFTVPFPQPGTLFICSDGLWGVLPEIEFFKLISKATNLQSACQDLVAAANDAGGPDNISVLLAQLVG